METTVHSEVKAVRAAAFKALRAELAGHVETARTARKTIRALKAQPSSRERGVELQAAWADKRYDSDTRRSLTLALAFLKGRPYAACERKATVAPYTGEIASMLTQAGIPTTPGMVGDWVTPKAVAEAAE